MIEVLAGDKVDRDNQHILKKDYKIDKWQNIF